MGGGDPLTTAASSNWRNVGIEVVERYRDTPMSENDERRAEINAELRAGFQAWADEHGVTFAATPSPLSEIELTLVDEQWRVYMPASVRAAFDAALRSSSDNVIVFTAEYGRGRGLFGEFVAKTDDKPIPAGKKHEVQRLVVPIVACGKAWTHAIQVDGGPYSHRGSGLPFAYCRFEQGAAAIEWHEGVGGRFFTVHAYEFILAESGEAADAWVANHADYWPRVSKRFREALAGIDVSKIRRIPMISLDPDADVGSHGYGEPELSEQANLMTSLASAEAYNASCGVGRKGPSGA